MKNNNYQSKCIVIKRIIKDIKLLFKKDSIQYVEYKIKQLKHKFPGIKIRYKYDELSNIHFIQIVPLDILISNAKYINWEEKMHNYFIKTYSQENICFLSENCILKIDDL